MLIRVHGKRTKQWTMLIFSWFLSVWCLEQGAVYEDQWKAGGEKGKQ